MKWSNVNNKMTAWKKIDLTGSMQLDHRVA